MAVKSSGPLSLTEIQAEFGGANPISLSEYYRGGTYVPNGPSQNANIATSGAINLGSFYGSVRAFTFNQTIAANTNNYNLRAAAIAAGWDQVAPLIANITINSGVIVGSASTGSWAFDTGASFPAGSMLALVNNGTIQGMGGQGGWGGGKHDPSSDAWHWATGGANGGPALRAQHPISITNNGTIAGGGGGGGGGGFGSEYYYESGGGGGGGGAGYYGGLGGAKNHPNNTFGSNGAGGSTSSGGAGGAGGAGWSDGKTTVPAGYAGGAGGGLGNGGATGVNGAGGGAGGAAVNGNGYITWVATGTRLGAIS